MDYKDFIELVKKEYPNANPIMIKHGAGVYARTLGIDAVKYNGGNIVIYNKGNLNVLLKDVDQNSRDYEVIASKTTPKGKIVGFGKTIKEDINAGVEPHEKKLFERLADMGQSFKRMPKDQSGQFRSTNELYGQTTIIYKLKQKHRGKEKSRTKK